MGIYNAGSFRRPGIKNYVNRMKADNRILFDDRLADILRTQDIEWKEDPRSIFDPAQLFTSLQRYDCVKNITIDKYLKAGISLARKVFARPDGHPHLTPLSLFESASQCKLDKSSGLPLMTTKRLALPYALNRAQQVLEGIKHPNPCLAYARTQAGNKTRLVWGYPFEMTIIEGIYAIPLIDLFKNFRTPMAIGLTKPELGSLLESVGRHKYIYALDYSKYDSSISSTLIYTAFDILKTWFHDEDFAWSVIINYFVRTPIVMHDGCLYKGKKHGVPSGSFFTQLIDSVVNVILIGALSSKFNLNLYWRDLLVLGDDSIFGTSTKMDLENAKEFLFEYGITLNAQKSKEQEIHFLGATWFQGLPSLDVVDLATKAVFPERFRKYEEVGDPRGVLLSYASQYIEGYRFVKTRDYAAGATLSCVKTKYLSGSDKYLLEYFPSTLKHFPTIAQRMLL